MRTITIHKVSFMEMLMNIFLLIYLLELVFPPITVLYNAPTIRMLCFTGWLSCSFMLDRNFYFKMSTKTALLIFYYIGTVIFPYMFGYPVIAHRYATIALVPMGYVIFQYYKKHNQLKKLQVIICVVMVFAVITLIKTLSELLINPYISRSIKSSGDYSWGLSARGIGGYHFVYFAAACAIPLLYLSIQSNLRMKGIFFILYILFAFLVLKANYMTAFISLIISSSIIVFLSVLNKRKRFGYLVFCFFLMAGIYLNSSYISVFVQDFLPTRISRVLFNVSNQTVLGAVWTELLLDRWPTILLSIESFIEYPIFGLLGAGKINVLDGALSGFGQHSYIFDTFSLYGIIFGVWSICVVFSPFPKNSKCSVAKTLDIAMYVCVISLYFFNNATDSIAFVIGIIYPLVREYMVKQQIQG